jgi:hypothetical protein
MISVVPPEIVVTRGADRGRRRAGSYKAADADELPAGQGAVLAALPAVASLTVRRRVSGDTRTRVRA